MKIKHYQGYGLIDAKVISRKLNTAERRKTVCVAVKGNHEYGLDRSDFPQDAAKWLLKVIKDSDLANGLSLTGPEGYNFSMNLTVRYEDCPYIRENGCDVENGIYTISFHY